jgi:hypothetical protein
MPKPNAAQVGFPVMPNNERRLPEPTGEWFILSNYVFAPGRGIPCGARL